MANTDWVPPELFRPDGSIAFDAGAPGVPLSAATRARLEWLSRRAMASPTDAELARVWVACASFWAACAEAAPGRRLGDVRHAIQLLGGCEELYTAVCANLATLSDDDDALAIRLFVALADAGARLELGRPTFEFFPPGGRLSLDGAWARRSTFCRESAGNIFNIVCMAALRLEDPANCREALARLPCGLIPPPDRFRDAVRLAVDCGRGPGGRELLFGLLSATPCEPAELARLGATLAGWGLRFSEAAAFALKKAAPLPAAGAEVDRPGRDQEE